MTKVIRKEKVFKLCVCSPHSKPLAREPIPVLTCNLWKQSTRSFQVGGWWQNMTYLRLKKRVSSDSFSDEELCHTSAVFISFQTGKSKPSYSPEQWPWLSFFLWHLVIASYFSEVVLCLFQGDELFRCLKTFPGFLSSFPLLFNYLHFWQGHR